MTVPHRGQGESQFAQQGLCHTGKFLTMLQSTGAVKREGLIGWSIQRGYILAGQELTNVLHNRDNAFRLHAVRVFPIEQAGVIPDEVAATAGRTDDSFDTGIQLGNNLVHQAARPGQPLSLIATMKMHAATATFLADPRTADVQLV